MHESTSLSDSATDRRQAWYPWLVCALLAVVTFSAYGWVLGTGLFLDDHLHLGKIRQGGWGWADLMDAARIEPRQFVDLWWQDQPVVWQYVRPLFILVLKVVDIISGQRAVAHHLVSLLLHLTAAILVWRLCLKLTEHRFWAVIGALLFVIYSHAVFAIGWIAAQNTVISTVLMLGGLLLYIRGSGLNVGPSGWRGSASAGETPESAGETPAPPLEGGTSASGTPESASGTPESAGETPAPPLEGGTSASGTPESASGTPESAGETPAPPLEGGGAPAAVPGVRVGSMLGFFALWLLAIGARENALMLAAVAVSFDLAFGGWRHVWARRWVILAMAVLGGVYAIWRINVVHDPLPDVYARHPDGPGYWLWCLAKLLHYVSSAIWLSPMTVGPTGRINPFTEVPGDCVFMIAIIAVMGGGYFYACRKAPGWWIWPMWLVLAVLPVVPILATPHSGYLCGVAFAVMMVLGPGVGRVTKPARFRLSAAVAIWFLVATSVYLPIYRTLWGGMVAAEHYTVAGLAADEPPDGQTDLFFINIPFVNIYVDLTLRERWGPAMDGVRCHTLTFAPNVIAMREACTLEQLDGYRFALSLRGRPYFSRLLGRFLLNGMHKAGRLHSGQTIRGELFDVHVVEVDQQGVRKLEFAFHEPLNSATYRFYLTSSECAGVRIRFRPPEAFESNVAVAGQRAGSPPTGADVSRAIRAVATGEADAALTLLDAAVHGVAEDREVAQAALLRQIRPVAIALGAPLAERLGDAADAVDWAEVRTWWRHAVDDRVLRAIQWQRIALTDLRETRDKIFTAREITRKIIRTDVYMTGPPFPGPQ